MCLFPLITPAKSLSVLLLFGGPTFGFIDFSLLLFFFFGCTHSMRKFPDQGSNLCHRSDNAKSLTARPPGNSSIEFCFKVSIGGSSRRGAVVNESD